MSTRLQRRTIRVLALTTMIGSLLVVVGLAGRPGAQAAAGGKYVISGGTVGAPIYAVGGLLATVMNQKMPGTNALVTTGQGFTALEQVHKGDAQIAYVAGHVIAAATAGIEPFKEPRKDIRILGRVAGLYFQLLVLADKNITSIADIAGKKIPVRLTTSPKGSLSEFSTRKVLEAYGIGLPDIVKLGGKLSYVSWADSANLMRDGHADAVSLFGVAPVPVFSELEFSRPLRLLVPSADVVKRLTAEQKGFSLVLLRAGVYKAVDRPTPTLGTFQTMIVREDMPEDVAYRIAKLAFDPENVKRFKGLIGDYADALTPEQAAQDLEAPLHPGAARYYRERGWLK